MSSPYFRVYGFQKVGFIYFFSFDMCRSLEQAHRLIWTFLHDPEFCALGTFGVVFQSPDGVGEFRFRKAAFEGFEYVDGWMLGEFEHEDIEFAKPRRAARPKLPKS